MCCFHFFHNFVELKLVILFSRLISFFPIFNWVMKNYEKLPIDLTTTPPPPPRLPVLQLDVPLLEREREGRGRRGWEYVGGGGWIRWGDGGTWGGWGYVRGYVVGWGVRWGEVSWGGGGIDVRSWSKRLFLGIFWKITTYWPPLDERVRLSFAESCKN